MNDKKIAILLVSAVLCLGGIFRQVQVNADSYTAGSTPSTLQSVVDTGNTASTTASMSTAAIVGSADGDFEALSVSHALGAGDGVSVTGHTGTGEAFKASTTGDGSYGFWANTTGTVSHGVYTNVTGPSSRAADFNATNASGSGILTVNQGSSSAYTARFENWNTSGAAAPVLSLFSYEYSVPNQTIFQIHSNNISTFPTACGGSVCNNQLNLLFRGNGHLAIGDRLSSGDNTNVLFASTTVPTGGIKVQNSDAGADGPIVTLYHKSASPAANDDVGLYAFVGNDSAGNETNYAYITGGITSPTHPNETGYLTFFVDDEGPLDPAMTITGGTDMITMTYPLTAPSIKFSTSTMSVYEQGTWTPLLSGSTIEGTCTATTTYGFYTQTGNVVNANINMTIANCDPDPTGTTRISLPVASNSDANYRSGCAVGLLNNYTLTANNILAPTISTNAAYVYLRQTPVGGGASSDAPLDEIFTINLSCTYLTN